MRTLIDFAIRAEYARVKALGDDLSEIGSLINWERFRFLEPLIYKNKTSRGGRPNIDIVIMVKALVIQHRFGLTDPELERQVADRISFCIFLGTTEVIPDFSTVWLFRERLIKCDVYDDQSRGKADCVASVSVDGKQWLGEGDLKDVSEQGTGMSINGLRLDQMGNLGTFSMQATSMSRADYEADLGQKAAKSEAESASTASSVASAGIGDTSSSVNYLNNPNAYVLTGWKWVTTDPQIKLYLKSDTLPNYLDLTATKNAIASAANTWENAVAQNLFADGEALVTVDPNVQANADDNKNVYAWGSISGGLAVTTTRYYTTRVNGYYPVYDSDTLYNTNYHWATDGNGQDIDVQSVALHELGHTIGLDDIYNKPQFSSDTDEIMNFYIGPRHSLGPGDKAGAQALYGATVPPVTGASGGYSFSGRT